MTRRRVTHFLATDRETYSPRTRPAPLGMLFLNQCCRARTGATPDVRAMAPSKRRKTSTAPEPTSGNTTQGVRTRRSASARSDVPDAPDADLEDKPEELLCPITRIMLRDPVMVVESGHTYG